MGTFQGASWIDISTALSFEGEMDVRYVVCDNGSKVEFTVEDGSIVSLTFSVASLRRFTAEAAQALAELAA
jgi:hypothetical protein